MTRAQNPQDLADRLRTEFPGRFDPDYAQVFAEMLLAGHGPDFGSGPWDASLRALVERDLDYSPSSRVPDVGRYLEAYVKKSRAARESLPWTTIAYGDDPMARIDYFPAPGTTRPLLIYLHGGYWQELSKEESAFMVEDLHAAGVDVAVLGHGLAPRLDIDAIVAMVRDGVRFLVDETDASRVYVAGSSAGAHLAAMCLPAVEVSGAILLSGVYDLTPLVDTYINGAVGMDEQAARRNSPIHHLPAEVPDLIVARGSNEPRGFATQHDELVRAVPGARALVVEGRNHFDLPMDLGDPSTVLGRAVLDVLTGARR